MRLFEAILDANHRALAGDSKAGLRPADFSGDLPVIALTCIDPRLNPILPEALGIPEEQFIWLRNAGNIVTGPLSSTMRSLALACAVKGGREIAIIGHTDCQVGHASAQIIERFRSVGVERSALPDNVFEFFGLFSNERQNVRKAAQIVRSSPLISPRIPVHGLLVDIGTGELELLVNGYDQSVDTLEARWNEVVKSTGVAVDALKSLTEFQIGEMKFPETKIGEVATQFGDWLSEKVQSLEVKPADPSTPPPVPPKVSVPPPLIPRLTYRKVRKG